MKNSSLFYIDETMDKKKVMATAEHVGRERGGRPVRSLPGSLPASLSARRTRLRAELCGFPGRAEGLGSGGEAKRMAAKAAKGKAPAAGKAKGVAKKSAAAAKGKKVAKDAKAAAGAASGGASVTIEACKS